MNKVIIIGDMLELGGNSDQYHLDLIAIINKLSFRELILIGKQMSLLVDKLNDRGIHVHYFTDVDCLKTKLFKILNKNDHVLIKSSNGIGLHKLFKTDDKKVINTVC